jgi:nucleoside-diphosphate-sugar epimerase
MRDDTILVTGGCGFLGSYIVEGLIADGNKVIVVDVQEPDKSNLKQLGLLSHSNLEIRTGSINDEAVWRNMPKNISRIVHAAAILGIEKVMDEQIETMDASILGTITLLQFAARQTSLERVLFLSSSEVYGVSARGSCEEDPAEIATNGGRWCYAASKLAAEFYVKAYAERFSFSFTIIRPFNVYGAYRHSPNAMTTIARHAVQGQPIRISGDGKQTRSWCHRKDFVRGVIYALFSGKAVNQTFNIGNDAASFSIIELANRICLEAGSTSAIIIDGQVVPDVMDRKPNIDKARRLLGYTPTVQIEEGIIEVVDWIRERHIVDAD